MTIRNSLLSMTALAAFAAAPAFAQTAATPPQAQPPQSAQGTTGTRDASGGVLAQATSPSGTATTPRDGTPGNPPSTATQRALDSVTGNRTPADGTPGNPPGTAAGRAADRTLGTNTTGTNPTGTNAAATGTTAPATTRAGTSAAATTAGLMPIESVALRNGRRASKMIGANLYNENNDSIGEVEDILMPMPTASHGGTAPTPVAIVSVGGFLGIGAKLVAVPYERLQWSGDRSRWTISGATKESLTALPGFSYEGIDRRG